MRDALSIQDILMILKKRIHIIFLSTIGLIIVAAVISYHVLTPTYQSASQFIVIQQPSNNTAVNANVIETNSEIINTYKEIAKSPSILEQVIEDMKLTITPEELSKRIQVTNGENSQVITISAIGSSPELAAQLANLVVEHFHSTIKSIMNIDTVYILSKANADVSKEPIKPRPLINMIVAGIIGMATSTGLIMFIEFIDTKVKSENDIEELGIVVLGVVSTFDNKRRSRRKRKMMMEEDYFEAEEEKKEKY